MNGYTALVQLLKAGGKLDSYAVSEILRICGRDWRSLVMDTVLDRSPRSGDRCPCGGHLVVYATKKQDGVRTQYLHCNKCGKRPSKNKLILRA